MKLFRLNLIIKSPNLLIYQQMYLKSSDWKYKYKKEAIVYVWFRNIGGRYNGFRRVDIEKKR